jgi:AGCS family alanine or glycine:cation symporter
MAALYIIGAFAVIFANLGNVGASFWAIFHDAFTGSAAAGGFLGATIAYAFNRGVNRGLFSNEAGQGSAPIAHASAKGDPVSEGMVSILEPFIDTILICTLTGLVILSSGVWQEKHDNVFDRSDMVYIEGVYSDQNEADKQQLFQYLNRLDGHDVKMFTGRIEVIEGKAVDPQFTLIAARSVAENVLYSSQDGAYTGVVDIEEGNIKTKDVEVSGKSLVHSTKLTTIAFTKGFFGDYGQYIVSLGLLLFAFSTSIAWSYYGDRAMTYLLGPKSVMPYRAVYVAGFMWAAVSDTTLVWALSAVAIVVMTLPNLFGIMMLRKEMKETVDDYVRYLDQQETQKE